jgi:hypothetical protein
MNLSCFNPQIFLASKVGDAALESEDGCRAGRPGHDLDIVIDAVRALHAAVPTDHLLPDDRLALDRLEELGRQVDLVTKRDQCGGAALSSADVDELIRKLRRLRRDDPASADGILRRLAEEAGPAAARTVTS